MLQSKEDRQSEEKIRPLSDLDDRDVSALRHRKPLHSGAATGASSADQQNSRAVFTMVSVDRHVKGSLENSDAQFRRLQKKFHKNPILGFASSQRQRYEHVKHSVDKIRSLQQDIFLAQFRQFGSEHEQQHGFKQDTELIQKLSALCAEIDEISATRISSAHDAQH